MASNPQYVPPPWLKENNPEEGSTHHSLNESNQGLLNPNSPDFSKKAALIHSVMKGVTILLCILMAITAVLGIGKFCFGKQTSNSFV
jgi:hypothetical protein